MVGYENVAMKDKAILVEDICKIGEEFLIICRGEKDLFPLIASRGDMVEGTFIHNPKRSCYGSLQCRSLQYTLSNPLSSVMG